MSSGAPSHAAGGTIGTRSTVTGYDSHDPQAPYCRAGWTGGWLDSSGCGDESKHQCAVGRGGAREQAGGRRRRRHSWVKLPKRARYGGARSSASVRTPRDAGPRHLPARLAVNQSAGSASAHSARRGFVVCRATALLFEVSNMAFDGHHSRGDRRARRIASGPPMELRAAISSRWQPSSTPSRIGGHASDDPRRSAPRPRSCGTSPADAYSCAATDAPASSSTGSGAFRSITSAGAVLDWQPFRAFRCITSTSKPIS